MAGKREAKREDLRERLIGAATSRMRDNGLAGLRARDITSDAGCALGGLYSAFEDLDALILAVNSLTLRQLDEIMTSEVERQTSDGGKLQALGAIYLKFARDNPNLWRALFQFHYPEGKALPDWYAQDQAKLLLQIVKPLRGLQPDMNEAALIVRARTLFAAVHGIVSISLEERFVGLPTATLDYELERFINLLLSGLKELKAEGKN
jgi:AcrR family transcriptional regulator